MNLGSLSVEIMQHEKDDFDLPPLKGGVNHVPWTGEIRGNNSIRYYGSVRVDLWGTLEFELAYLHRPYMMFITIDIGEPRRYLYTTGPILSFEIAICISGTCSSI
jgi:hypothetical protein